MRKGDPSPELHRGGDARALCCANPSTNSELPDAGPSEPDEPTLLFEKAMGQDVDGLCGVPRPEQQRDELGVGERVDADVDETFTRTRCDLRGRMHAERCALGVPAVPAAILDVSASLRLS
jgi:hypothetical protein